MAAPRTLHQFPMWVVHKLIVGLAIDSDAVAPEHRAALRMGAECVVHRFAQENGDEGWRLWIGDVAVAEARVHGTEAGGTAWKVTAP